MLSETYGIMVYQEQVMQTAQILGGYSLGGADLLRRAMGKKKAEEMAEHREIFRKGAAKNGIDEDKADEIFDLMEKFAGYGFNKSHAAAYSLLAYHTGWLKVHYTAEFFCANMTVEMDDTDKLKVLFEDAQKNFGMTFEPPDVNRGNYRFEPVTDKVIRYGLGAVKGTGQRPSRPSSRRARRAARSRACSTSACAWTAAHQQARGRGADQGRRLRFAAAEPRLADRLGRPRLRVRRARPRPTPTQGGMFDFGDCEHGSATQEPELVDATPWGVKERLTSRRRPIGFYLSGHLFDEVAHEVRRFCQARDRRPDRQPRAAGAGRHRQRLPRHQRPARPARDLQAGRQVGRHRGDRRRGAASTPTATCSRTTNW